MLYPSKTLVKQSFFSFLSRADSSRSLVHAGEDVSFKSIDILHILNTTALSNKCSPTGLDLSKSH